MQHTKREPSVCQGAVVFCICFVVGLPEMVSADGMAVSPDIVVATSVADANSNTSSPGRPAVGFDGANYLVVTSRSIAPVGLTGILLSRRGVILDQFPVNGSAIDYPWPALAFDGTNYLLTAGVGGEIRGWRIAPDGRLVDASPGFPISSTGGSNWSPSVAFDGENHLVVWMKFKGSHYDIYGARVAGDGQVIGGEFLVFTAPLEQAYPQVSFDGSNYLVVWQHERGTWPDLDRDIYGTRVSPAGTVLEPAGISICSAPQSQDTPHLAFDGTNHLVVWLDQRNHASDQYVYDIFGTRVAPDGNVLDGTPAAGGIAINTLHAEYKNTPRVCYDGEAFFITWWIAAYEPPAGCFATRVTSGGELLDGPADSSGIQIRGPEGGARKIAHPNPVSDGGSVLVCWVDNAETSGTRKDVLASFVTPPPKMIGLVHGSPGVGDVAVTFASRSNVLYQVEASDDLATWMNLGDTVVGNGDPLPVPLPGAGVSARRFFRVKIDY